MVLCEKERYLAIGLLLNVVCKVNSVRELEITDKKNTFVFMEVILLRETRKSQYRLLVRSLTYSLEV